MACTSVREKDGKDREAGGGEELLWVVGEVAS